MRVAVTGGTGFLGAHLARALAARGDDVICLDVATSTPLLEDVEGVRIVRCDVGWWPELIQAVQDAQPELIFHSAGILSAFAEERPHAAYRVNTMGTLNVLEAARIFGDIGVVFTSTIATYGPGVGETVTETTQQRPTTMYGVTKVFGELLGEYYVGRFGLDYRGIRLASVIGPGRGPGGASAYSSLIVSEPAHGRAFKAPVTEETTMPLVYVKDAVDALLQIAAAEEADLTRRTYGISGFSPTAGELAEAVRGAVPGADISFAPDEQLVAIVHSWPQRLDTSEASGDWGWTERFDLARAVGDFVGELKVNPTWP